MHSVPQPLRCLIKNLDTREALLAGLNPKDLQVAKQVPWVEHKAASDRPPLEYTKGSPMEFSVELLFDTYETRENVFNAYVHRLLTFAEVNPDLRRPPMLLFLWGTEFPPFMGVIVSLQVTYTMFLRDGRPVRATCQVKLKQADRIRRKKDPMSWADSQARFAERGKLALEEEERRADLFALDHRAVLEAHGSEDGTLTRGKPVWTITGRRG